MPVHAHPCTVKQVIGDCGARDMTAAMQHVLHFPSSEHQ